MTKFVVNEFGPEINLWMNVLKKQVCKMWPMAESEKVFASVFIKGSGIICCWSASPSPFLPLLEVGNFGHSLVFGASNRCIWDNSATNLSLHITSLLTDKINEWMLHLGVGTLQCRTFSPSFSDFVLLLDFCSGSKLFVIRNGFNV